MYVHKPFHDYVNPYEPASHAAHLHIHIRIHQRGHCCGLDHIMTAVCMMFVEPGLVSLWRH
jgi:hypothetical protein